jgi:hypothetical protein
MPLFKKKSVIVRLALVSAAVLVAGVLCLLLLPLPPDGKYRNRFVANGGRAYFEFQAGRVTLAVPGDSTNDWGSYTKTNGQWLWRLGPGSNDVFVLRATGVGLRASPRDEPWSNWYPRLWLSPMPKE